MVERALPATHWCGRPHGIYCGRGKERQPCRRLHLHDARPAVRALGLRCPPDLHTNGTHLSIPASSVIRSCFPSPRPVAKYFPVCCVVGHKPRPWQQGSLVWAMELLENGLRVNRQMSSPFVAALVLEVLCWVHATRASRARSSTDGSRGTTAAVHGQPCEHFPYLPPSRRMPAADEIERAVEELGSNRQGFLYGSALIFLGLTRELSGDPRGRRPASNWPHHPDPGRGRAPFVVVDLIAPRLRRRERPRTTSAPPPLDNFDSTQTARTRSARGPFGTTVTSNSTIRPADSRPPHPMRSSASTR